MRHKIALLLSFLAFSAVAEVVHVYEKTSAGGVIELISDRTLDTGCSYTTTNAPTKSGYIFTHWSISTAQAFEPRDAWSRAYDSAPFKLYEETTLTANYLPASQDSDSNGMADGYELYWYGATGVGPSSDTDYDCKTFAEEIAAGTNPLFAERHEDGPVAFADGALLLYNPHGYAPYTIRSEPEGVLFETISEYVMPGTVIDSGTADGNFAYWERRVGDNAPCQMRDAWGRADDSISMSMPTNAVEFIAHAESDHDTRMSLYWYGNSTTAMDSDTDGDGKTFAEELAAGTNPLFPERHEEGPVAYADSDLLQYNPYNLQPYTIRSDPEGSLFATTSGYVRAGWQIDSSSAFVPDGLSEFAYWERRVGDNEPSQMRDAWGRADDSISMSMPTNAVEFIANAESDYNTRMSLYWYGNTTTAMDSDTDGDGKAFAEELAAGTNPLFAERHEDGPIQYADSALHEVNLQPYEQVQGTVVGNEYAELFTSPVADNGGTSRTFDGAATPTVVDLNGDGRFDLVVETSAGTRTVFLNEGDAGNPMFVENAWNAKWYDALAAAKTNTIDGLQFDTPPINPGSWSFADVDRDGIVDLLVADSDGRIWYYRGTGNGDQGTGYVLQHKVFGGSFAGFAEGLKIAAVDWDDDGDVDLVCGTLDGKLMLLNDPRIGRPVNLTAEAGATSVVLTWDPNVNSRVRGYGVYRSADSNVFTKIENMCPLPRYRDTPPTIQNWWYRVTGKSRFYVAGNSTPIEYESIPTDAIHVQMRPSVWLNDTSSFTETNVEVVVSMNNSMGLSADGFSMTFEYDPTVLTPVEVKQTGLTVALDLVPNAPQGGSAWEIFATGGEIGIGAGEFLRLVFYVKPVHDVAATTVTLASATVKSEAGQHVSLELPKSAKIDISDANPLQPAVVSMQVGNAAVATGEEFELPFTITSSEVLTSGVFSVTYDSAMLEWKGAGVPQFTSGSTGTVSVVATESGVLPFKVCEQHSVITNFSTIVSVSGFSAVDCNGFEVAANDSQGEVLIKNSYPILPAVVSVATEDRKVDTLETVTVPFKVISTESIASGSFTVEWDSAVLDFIGRTGVLPVQEGQVTVSSTCNFSLTFLAKDQHDVTKTQVRLTAASVVDVHGFAISPVVPVVSTILIHDAHPLVPAKVSMTLSDVAAQTESEFEMTLAITSTETLTALRMSLSYDTSLLELRSGVMEYSGTVPSAVTLRFYAKENHTVDKTTVTVTPISATDANSFTAEVELPASVVGNVILADSNPWQSATVAVGIAGAKVDTRSEFALPAAITSNEMLTNFVATVTWNENALEFRGVTGAACATRPPYQSGDVQIAGDGGNFTLSFYAKDQHDIASANVGLSNMTAVDNHGLVANAIADVSATVLIHDVFPLLPAEVAVKAGTVNADTRSTFAVPVAVTSSKVLTNFCVTVSWDENVLEWRGVDGTACAARPPYQAAGTQIVGDGAGFALTFFAKDQHTVKDTAITLSDGAAYCTDGLAANVALENGKVILTDSNPPAAVNMAISTLDARAESGKAFVVPLGATTDGDLAELTTTVEWDAVLLEFNGAEAASVAGHPPYQGVATMTFPANGIHNLFDLEFTARAIAGLRTNATVRVTAAGGTGANSLAAKVTTKLPVESTVLIVRTISKYDPGDINGDGKYTDADMTLLQNYIKYQSIVSVAPQLASRYASWKLTGKALKAADVNEDGKIDANDVSMLAQFIASAKEGN